MAIIEDAIAQYQSLLSQRDGLLVSVEDLKNQILTAELQHGNDQQAIAALRDNLAADDTIIASDGEKIRGLTLQLNQALTQLAAIPQAAYPDLEWGIWQMNKKPDDASGLGDASFVTADNPKTPAMLSIIPAPPIAGAKDNYFNVYWTQKKKPDATVTNFVLTGKFDFPTDTDMKNAHCIEFEGRQVLRLIAPATLPLMSVPALQCNFSSGQLRYFNALAAGDNWVPTGIPMPRQRSIAVEMEAHRDDKTLYYDAFTINGKRYPVSFQAPLYAKTYVNERLSVSLQLDSHYLAGPFKVSPSGIALKVW